MAKRAKKRALITGITGQDGSYLAEFLVGKGYEVYGFLRRTSTDPLARIEDLYEAGKIHLIYGNMRDVMTIERALDESQPDEIYNLAAQSHVGISFLCPEETWDINYYGVERLLKAAYKRNKKVKIYQASTSEMFGETPPPQDEHSKFSPVSPYAEAKLKAHQLIEKYRKKGFFATSGILFNHESSRRGKHFVTRKLTYAFAKMKLGLLDHVRIGNLDAQRDWGYAGDYVRAMHAILQQKKPGTYVIASGQMRTVRELVDLVAKNAGMTLAWTGSGERELGKDEKGIVRVVVDPKFYRPREVEALCGNPAKARRELKWKQRVSFEELIATMVKTDIKILKGIHIASD